MSIPVSRRQFLKISSTAMGGLMVGACAAPLPDSATLEKEKAIAGETAGLQPWSFVRIEPDGAVIIGARGCEIGQGVKTSLPMLIAEELDVPWAQVTVEQLPFAMVATDSKDGRRSKYGAQGAGGSTSIPDSWNELRQLGAQVRHLLKEAAADRWNLPVDTLRTSDAMVHAPDGRAASYGELAARAAVIPETTEPATLKTPAEFRIIGRPTLTTDSHDIVTGQAEYGLDAYLDSALVAVVARCPYFEGSLRGLDDSAARAVAGVREIVILPGPNSDDGLDQNLAAGVAVVADDTWSAMKGRDALRIDWQPGRWAGDSTADLERRAEAALRGSATVARSNGDLDVARASASQVVEASYGMPLLAHCTMEPQNALLDLRADSALLIASTQSPFGAARMIQSMTGIDSLNIEVRLPRSGGGFGRRLEADFVAEAVHIAQAVKTPVKLVWSREDDLQNDWYRPCGRHELTATLDSRRRLTGWGHRAAATDRRFGKPGFAKADEWIACLDPDAFPAGCVDNYRAEFVALQFGVARGWWRGPLPSFTAFAIGSFMDEVAHAAGRDPLEFQLEVLGEPRTMDYSGHGGPILDTGRLATVVRKAAEAIDYGRSLPDGHGIGLATHFVFGGYAAHAMEVSVADGRPVIHRCVCAIDVGQVVNPLGVEAQMMGGTIDGLSTALNLEITVQDGRIQQRNFPDYRLLGMAGAPDVEVHIVHSSHPPGGAGEMGIPTAAPALANAIFAATGKRIRRLPIGDQLV